MRPQLPYSLVRLASLTLGISGSHTVTDSPKRTLWDGGKTRWDKRISIPGKPHFHGGTIWDQPKQTIWDGGATRWLDTAPGWDTQPGTSTRRWVIGKANPNIYNLRDASGTPLLARILIQPPDPRSTAQLTQRAKLATAHALWATDRANMIQLSKAWAKRHYQSEYHCAVAWYITTH